MVGFPTSQPLELLLYTPAATTLAGHVIYLSLSTSGTGIRRGPQLSGYTVSYPPVLFLLFASGDQRGGRTPEIGADGDGDGPRMTL